MPSNMEQTWSSNKSRYEKVSLCASLFLHALLFLVLSTTSNFEPAIGKETRIDLLWLTPAPTMSPAPQASGAVTAKETPAGGKMARQRSAAGHSRAGSDIFLSSGLPASPGDTGKRSTGGAALRNPASQPDGARALSDRKDGSAAARRESPPPPAVAAPRSAGEAAHATASKEAPVPIKGAVGGRSRQQEAATAKAPTVQHDSDYERMQTQQPTTAIQQLPKPDGELKVAAKPPDSPLTRSPATQPPQNRGLVIASLQGDLKMLVSGDGVKLSVSFREHPRARRNKMPTRSEARRLQSIVPVCASRGDQTREAVIEKAGEGVYVFSAESEHEEAAQATFTLKIYEAGTGAKVAALGPRSIARKTVVAKILMPEAILWDDADAFTGSLEDSDSTTKFNSQTGLYWKEYDN